MYLANRASIAPQNSLEVVSLIEQGNNIKSRLRSIQSAQFDAEIKNFSNASEDDIYSLWSAIHNASNYENVDACTTVFTSTLLETSRSLVMVTNLARLLIAKSFESDNLSKYQVFAPVVSSDQSAQAMVQHHQMMYNMNALNWGGGVQSLMMPNFHP